MPRLNTNNITEVPEAILNATTTTATAGAIATETSEPQEEQEAQVYTCDYCDTEKEGEPELTISDKNYCSDCSDLIASCGDCGNVIETEHDDYWLSENSGEYYCESCKNDHSFECADCSERFDGASDYSDDDDNSICESCSENYINCNNCDYTMHTDNSHYCENCESDLCENCYSEHECENGEDREERIASENLMKAPSDQFLKGTKEDCKYITIDRFVGVEIEAENGKKAGLKDLLPIGVGVSHDGSLGATGLELQTPPASLNKFETIVSATCQALRTQGYIGTKASGLHVHIDARDFKSDHTKVVQVIKTFYSIEDILFSMLPPSRWGNQYCKRLSEGYLYNNFKKVASENDVAKQWYKETNDVRIEEKKKYHRDSSRYYGLNIHSLFYRGTIEFRYHSGTTNERKILSWAQILLSIVDYAINRYDDEEIERLFSTETGHEKLRHFYSMFNLNYDITSYIDSRISKFNPNLNIKFNKGESGRKIDKMIRKDLEKEYKKVFKEFKDRMTKTYELEIERGNIKKMTKKAILEHIKNNWEREAKYNYPQFEKLNSEIGFIKPEELNGALALIRQGQRMQQENSETGTTRDLEE